MDFGMIAFGFAVGGLFLSLATLIWSAYIFSEVRGLKESTHRVTYVDPMAGVNRDEEGFTVLSKKEQEEFDQDPTEIMDNLQ